MQALRVALLTCVCSTLAPALPDLLRPSFLSPPGFPFREISPTPRPSPTGKQSQGAQKPASSEFLSIADRLKVLGVPKLVPPGAWCSQARMTAAIPVTFNPALSGQSMGGFGKERGCGSSFAEDFYGPGRHALIASTQYDECGVRSVTTDRYVYYSHTLRAPGAENNAMITCACPRLPSESAERRSPTDAKKHLSAPVGDGKGGCLPSTKWEHTVNAQRTYEGTSAMPALTRAVAQGHFLSVSTNGGSDYTTSMSNDDDGMVFQALVHGAGGAAWPWPMTCDAVCPDEMLSSPPPDCIFHFIVDGCPVNQETVDFHILKHTAGSDMENDPAEITFRVRPLAFRHYDRLKVRCQMAVFPFQPMLSELCAWSKELSSQSPNDGGHNRTGNETAALPYIPGLLSRVTASDDSRGRSEHSYPLRYASARRRMQGVASNTTTDDAHTFDPTHFAQTLLSQDASAPSEDVASLINSIPEGEKQAVLAALAVAGGDVSQLSTYLDTVPEEEREAVSAALLVAAFIGANGPRARSYDERAIREVRNEIVYDNWALSWGRDWGSRESRVRVGNDRGYVGVGGNLDSRAVDVSTGFDKTHISYYGDETDIEYGVGIWHGKYGAYVSRDFDERQTTVETLARGVETGTTVDFADRDYGQRVKVRDVEVMVRHDFDDVQDSTYGDDEELATEVVVAYKSTRIAVGADVNDTEYAVSVGTLGRQISVLRDFDERETDVQANWGDGYQLVLNGDFPDDRSDEIYGQVGFGKVGKLYAQVGAGVGDDGIPQGAAEIEAEDVGVGVDFIDDDGDRLFLYRIAIGKFSYTWESEVVPDNILLPDIPTILGFDISSDAQNATYSPSVS